MTSPRPSPTYRVVVSVTRDFHLDVAATSPRAAREQAGMTFASWSPLEEACHVAGEDRTRVRLATPGTGRCPLTEDLWPEDEPVTPPSAALSTA